MNITRFLLFLLPAMAILQCAAWGEELSPRETRMLGRIDELESRLAEMEAVVRALQSGKNTEESTDAAPVVEGSAAPVAKEAAPSGPVPLQAYFNNGLQLRSENGAFDIRVGGRTQLDFAFFDVDEQWERLADRNPQYGFGDENDGVGFRRARLSIRGKIHENIGFKAQYDFATENGQFRDVFIELQDLPFFDKARIGHFQEPFSLEEMTSNSYMTFMERSIANVFVPSFNTGLTVEKSMLKKRLHWTLGIFKSTDFFPSRNDSNEAAGYAVTGRVTGVPWMSEDGRTFVHLGANFTRRNPDGPLNFRQRPESSLAQRYLSTSPIDTESQFTYGLDAAFVHGPLSLQGEYIATEIDTILYGERNFSGYYAALSWFITGENRPYKKGAFWRVTPKNPYRFRDGKRGWGAWELALRYSHADLNDGPIWGGEETNTTIGVNWHLNTNTRIMTNYIYAQPENFLYDGDLTIFQTRFQVDF